MSVTRVVFMGSPDFAVPSLQALHERCNTVEVVGVFTQPDKPAGRGRKLKPSAIKQAALEFGLPVHEPRKMRPQSTRELLAGMKPDLAVVAAYGRILPPSLLEVPPLGCVNVHASLLPRYRGASPIAHALLAGDSETGISIMKMDEGMDTGAVYRQRAIPIEPEDTCGSLTEKLAHTGAELLLDTLPEVVAGTEPTPQDDPKATMAPLLSKQAGALNFELPAVVLERQLRAFDPWPGSYGFSGELRLQVLSATTLPESGTPGTVLRADKHGILVACKEGSLLITELKPAGKKAMSAAAFVAGRGMDTLSKLSSAPQSATP